MRKDFSIDIVIPWVDGSDKEWLKEKNKYLPKEDKKNIDVQVDRYRDWDNLQYIFRGIEKFCPWVNKVFFITCGQKPKWLNINCEKLVVINHKDYIPKEYLPTFSSHPIELNMHRIKGLSEHFIYLNDDFFFLNKTNLADFFSNKGLPKVVAIEKPISVSCDQFNDILMNNFKLISKKFDKKLVKKGRKWYSCKNIRGLIINKFFDFINKSGWTGFYFEHLPAPFLKSSIEDCWQVFGNDLDRVSKNKFRSNYDVNQYLFTQYQICTGKFEPDRMNRKGRYLLIDSADNIEKTCQTIKKQKYKMVCINDAGVQNFEYTKNKINSALQEILPEKSSFEV